MMSLHWKRALSAGIALSIVLAAMSLSTADDGEEVATFVTTLVACLVGTALVVLAARWLQRRSPR